MNAAIDQKKTTYSVDECETDKHDCTENELCPKDPSPTVDGIIACGSCHSQQSRNRGESSQTGQRLSIEYREPRCLSGETHQLTAVCAWDRYLLGRISEAVANIIPEIPAAQPDKVWAKIKTFI
jgi:hypothetical protein